MHKVCINSKQLALGLLFLLAGTLEYLVSRPTSTTLFLNKLEPLSSFFHSLPHLYGELGIYAPDFFHTLAFSLMAMAYLGSGIARASICVGWILLDCMFELGQMYGVQLVDYLGEWMEIDTIKNYFVNGTFDICDLIAIILGGMSALVLGELLSKEEVYDGKNN